LSRISDKRLAIMEGSGCWLEWYTSCKGELKHSTLGRIQMERV